MKVLIIEDEAKTRDTLRAGLTAGGFEVGTAADGEEGLSAAREGGNDLIVLDVMLPHRDGFSILQTLRAAGDPTPVVMLTARGTVEDRVKGLEWGADDYLVKPFALDELVARVRSVLRRTSRPERAVPAKPPDPDAPHTVQIGDLEVDLVRHRATRGGKRLRLTPKEFALLSLLARRRGQVLSRPIIAEQVWDVAFDGGTNVVDVHVRRLRAKADDPFDRKLIHTVRGAGYVMDERS